MRDRINAGLKNVHVCTTVPTRRTQPCFYECTWPVSSPRHLCSPRFYCLMASVSRSPRSTFSRHRSAELAQADLVSSIKHSCGEKERERWGRQVWHVTPTHLMSKKLLLLLFFEVWRHILGLSPSPTLKKSKLIFALKAAGGSARPSYQDFQGHQEA